MLYSPHQLGHSCDAVCGLLVSSPKPLVPTVISQENFKNVGFLVAATIVAMILQYLLVYLGAFWLFTRWNV